MFYIKKILYVKKRSVNDLNRLNPIKYDVEKFFTKTMSILICLRCKGKEGKGEREGRRDSNYDVTIAGVLGRVHPHVIQIRNRPVSRTLRGIEPSYFSKRFHNAEKARKIHDCAYMKLSLKMFDVDCR